MHQVIEAMRRAQSVYRRRHETLAIARMNCCERDAANRKTLPHRYLDLTYSILRWNELSALYYAQGIDQKESRIGRDYLSYTRFRKLRDGKNAARRRSTAYNYACLLQDKLAFERYFSAGKLPIQKSLGEVGLGGKGRFNGNLLTDICDWGHRHFCDQDLFVKPRFGIKGSGVFKVRFSGDNLILVNEEEVSREQLVRRVTAPCIVQKVIDQHQTTAQLHPSSLNTLRVITYLGDTDVEVFLAYLRMGGGGGITDNNNNQRVIVRIDEETGRLYEQGYALSKQDSKRTTQHSDTGVQFKGVVIPGVRECLETAMAAHRWVPEFFSVGWDVAITPSGPLLVEGNDDWGATTAMWAMPDFAERFYHMIGERGS